MVSAPSGAGKSTVLSRVLARPAGPALLGLAHDARAASGRDGRRRVPLRDAAEPSRRCRSEGALLEWAEVHGELYGTGLVGVSRGRAPGSRPAAGPRRAGRRPGAGPARGRGRRCSCCRPRSRPSKRGFGDGATPREETIRRRLQAAASEVRHYGEYDYVVVNDDLDACVGSLSRGGQRRPRRTCRMAAQAARVLATFPTREGELSDGEHVAV